MGNFIITELPSCELKPMANSDKAYMWVCHDFSDSVEGQLEKLAIRFQTADLAAAFKAQFEAAQTFNGDAKAGKDDLKWATEVEDLDEKQEDDIDVNKTADQEGD